MSTVVPNLLAIPYNVSPFSTIYVDTSGKVSSEISNVCPMVKVFEVRLFSLLMVSTVVPNLFAILYSVSPRLTV